MGLLRHRRSFEDRVRGIEEEMMHQERVAADKESAVLAAISEKTDPVADAALLVLETINPSQKEAFIRRVFQNLVLQTLFEVDALDSKTALSHIAGPVGRTISGYGTGRTVVVIPRMLEKAVVDKSLDEISVAPPPVETA